MNLTIRLRIRMSRSVAGDEFCQSPRNTADDHQALRRRPREPQSNLIAVLWAAIGPVCLETVEPETTNWRHKKLYSVIRVNDARLPLHLGGETAIRNCGDSPNTEAIIPPAANNGHPRVLQKLRRRA